MSALDDSELLALWELGASRHPLDRAMLLCAWARPDLPPDRLGDLPLGAVNASLFRLRAAGGHIALQVDCPGCDEALQLELDAGPQAGAEESLALLDLHGFRYRSPSLRDLAEVAGETDLEIAALKLLDRCCVERPVEPKAEEEPSLAEVERGLEELDPVSDIVVAVTCTACGHAWTVECDVVSLVWDEIAARARDLLSQVHLLARTYGWAEAEILALGPRRRAVYLGMVSA